MGLLWLIILGAAAGFFATRVMQVRTGVLQTVLIGMGGAFIGGLVLRGLIAVTGALAGLVGAVLGAILLIWIFQKFGPR
ncbi:GlsB/YeaQ/YmgE family stress response membrane protein [Alloyangia pacifica]|uniref:GlsB/YeaQ/YmgE family stress response membrane protein n=1 Tax=Alloyangia pacifica TaxID=311180 RepID=UPI001CD3AB70|nr:GlsB/YeaQ/YmgE family stress response membrane protein [Alloyangia pacifica]MCA0997458.1 GlsB/YeaQ/YmgE family stress response membrane protein [Alloyangia pacifica]